VNWPPDNTYVSVRNWLTIRVSEADEREKGQIVATLMEHFGGASRAQLIASGYRFTESQLNRLNEAATAISGGMPVQYAIGEAWFYNRRFTVSPATLIPRPETEELVSHCLKRLQPRMRVLDIGTGSGCIAISLALEIERLHVDAWDSAPDAVAVARQNGAELYAGVNFSITDVFSARVAEPYDLIVSNPPYIPLSEQTELADRVQMHEPHQALFVENDPLVFYRHIVHQAPLWLKNGGALCFECHYRYADQVQALCEQALFAAKVSLVDDANGKPRMVFADLPPLD